MKTPKIIFASLPEGMTLKLKLMEQAQSLGLEVEDLGTNEKTLLDSIDLSKQMTSALCDPNFLGVLICSNGHEMTIAANRSSTIRAAFCHSPEEVKMVRHTLDANLLCLEIHSTSLALAVSCFDAFVKTSFEKKKYEKTTKKLGVNPTIYSENGIHLIVRALILHKKHLLLATTTKYNKEFSSDLYFLPGGHVDYQESALVALQREIKEEMNALMHSIDFIGALECSWDRKGHLYHELNLVYKVELPNLSLTHPPESTEPFLRFFWCPISELATYKILPQQLLPMIQEALGCQNHPLFYSQLQQKI